MVELREAGGQLAAPGAGAGDDHDRPLGGDVVVGAVALVADDAVDVGGVAAGEAVGVDGDAAALEPGLEHAGRRLVLEAGDDHGPHQEAPVAQVVDELEGVGVVGDAEVGAHLALLDGARVDADDDLGLVLELLQQADLDVGVVAGQDAGGVEVEGDLAAELEIELAADAARRARRWRGSARRGTSRCRNRRLRSWPPLPARPDRGPRRAYTSTPRFRNQPPTASGAARNPEDVHRAVVLFDREDPLQRQS